MQIDSFTYFDLSIFHPEESFSVFHRLNFTRTSAGKDRLMACFREPYSDAGRIRQTQQILKAIQEKIDQWPSSITNGTLLVIEKFYDYALDPLPRSADLASSFVYRILHGPDFSLVRYSLQHVSDLIRTMYLLTDLFRHPDTPPAMQKLLHRIAQLINRPETQWIAQQPPNTPFNLTDTIRFGQFFHDQFRTQLFELMDIYAQFDAWYSMAMANKTYELTLPDIIEQPEPLLEASGMYHLLLPQPVPYDVKLNKDSNFIFLTGANMAGKSTFIKSTGLAVFLAHIGMGVPAKKMRMSLFDGILSNITVTDNIVKGESFFFNEVQRIKNTVLRINDGKKWLVLIDELFKGTNIQDAMKCSLTVIRGLIRIHQSLFILSTHLYEIGEELNAYPNISFKYFETSFTEQELTFSYQLKDGISQDRLGYLILQREGVVQLLESLK